MRVILSSAAERDVKRALDYYMQHAGAGVADDLIDRIEAKLQQIKKNPTLYRIVAEDLRCAELERFPNTLVYRMLEEDLIQVTTVRHHRQNPDFGLRR